MSSSGFTIIISKMPRVRSARYDLKTTTEVKVDRPMRLRWITIVVGRETLGSPTKYKFL